MITGNYYLIGDDGFGRLVILDASEDAGKLERQYRRTVNSTKYSAVYIIHIVRGHIRTLSELV